MNVAERVLVACVGNVLRGDDGFGPAVAARLEGSLPEGVRLVETGIGGIALLQELLGHFDGLVVVDAVDEGEAPGSVVVIEPDVDGSDAHVPDVHLANPGRVLALAKALDVLPARVVIVGCQPLDCAGFGQGLSSPVRDAVELAASTVRRIVEEWADQFRLAASSSPENVSGNPRGESGRPFEPQSFGMEDHVEEKRTAVRSLSSSTFATRSEGQSP